MARVTFENSLDLASGETLQLPHLIVTTVFHTDGGLVGFSAERDEAAAAARVAAAAAEEGGESSGGGDDDGMAVDEAAAKEQQQEEDRRPDGESGGSSSSSSSSSSPEDADADDADADADAPDPDDEAAAMAAMGLPVSFGGGGGAADSRADGEPNPTTNKKKKKKKKRCWRPPLHARQSLAPDLAAAAAKVLAWAEIDAAADDLSLSLRLRQEIAEEPRAQALLRALGLWEEDEEEGDERHRHHHHHHHHHHPRHRHHVKYWLQRYSLFSKYDAGVRLDVEGWYSVTPECVALWQARRALAIVAPAGAADAGGGPVVLDAFAGCGGNTIALRRALDDSSLGIIPSLLSAAAAGGAPAANVAPPTSTTTTGRVVAVEIDRARLRMARHNARVYGLSRDSIEWIRGDFFRAFGGDNDSSAADVVFFSPPWGGPAYRRRGAVFGLADQPLPGIGRTLGELLDFGRRVVQRGRRRRRRRREEEDESDDRRLRGVVVAFLPRNTDVQAIAQMAAEACVSGSAWGDGGDWELERNVLNGHLKGVTLYCPVGV
jgi:trimethylguanosine synthase